MGGGTNIGDPIPSEQRDEISEKYVNKTGVFKKNKLGEHRRHFDELMRWIKDVSELNELFPDACLPAAKKAEPDE